MGKENQFNLLPAMVNQTRIEDSGIKQLIQQQFRGNQEQGKKKNISKETIRRLRIQNKKLQEQVASLREQLRYNREDRNQLASKLNHLMKLNTSLAKALGSCDNCWGEDPDCTICSGEGYPGWRKINKRLFNLYVLPTLEKLSQ